MKNVLITGGNRGIGLEFARQYKEDGHNVYVLCRKGSEELKELGVNVVEGFDVENIETIESVAKEMKDISIDILINNAGIFLNETLDEMDYSSVERQFKINTLGPLAVTMSFLYNLKDGSKVGIVSSRMGSVADNTSGSYYGYRMSKAGVNAIGKSLANDLSARGISVALLHPGYVKTKMTGFNGDITPDVAASGLIKRMNELNLENSGSFWHSNGEKLPW